MSAKKGKELPKRGNILPPTDLPMCSGLYEQFIGEALRRELGGSHRAAKTLMRWTGASERTVKNWYSGKVGPSGVHLVDLMTNSDATFEAVLLLTGRKRTDGSEGIRMVRQQALEILALLDEIEDGTTRNA